MSDLQELLDQIEQLDKEATQGPWEYDKDEGEIKGDSRRYKSGLEAHTEVALGISDTAAGEFMALSRTLLPKFSRAISAVIELLDNEEKVQAEALGNIFFGGEMAETRISVNILRLALANALEE